MSNLGARKTSRTLGLADYPVQSNERASVNSERSYLKKLWVDKDTG